MKSPEQFTCPAHLKQATGKPKAFSAAAFTGVKAKELGVLYGLGEHRVCTWTNQEWTGDGLHWLGLFSHLQASGGWKLETFKKSSPTSWIQLHDYVANSSAKHTIYFTYKRKGGGGKKRILKWGKTNLSTDSKRPNRSYFSVSLIFCSWPVLCKMLPLVYVFDILLHLVEFVLCFKSSSEP